MTMTRPTGAEIARGVAIGVAVAGIAALAPWAVVGSGLVALATQQSRRKSKPVQAASLQRDSEGRLLDWQAVLRGVQRGGISPELRPELWPLLLGVWAPSATEDERLAVLAQLRKQYTKLVLICQELERQSQAADGSSSTWDGDSAGAAGGAEPGPAAAAEVPGNVSAFAESHRIIVVDAVRTDFSSNGGSEVSGEAESKAPDGGAGSYGDSLGSPTVTILPVAVVDGIPELVFVDHPAPAPAPTEGAGATATGPGHSMNGNTPLWNSKLAAEVLGQAGHVSERSRAQMLRLVNLLSAYAVHDPETSYCQGMSDLAAVFIQLFEDDAVAFACFERLMRQARRNFRHDEEGIKQQLRQIAGILEHTDPSLYQHLCRLGAQDCMFAYRMVVVMLRRELAPEFAMTLWEMQWALEASAVPELEEQGAQQQGAPAAQPGGPLSRASSVHSMHSTHSVHRSGSSSSMLAAAAAAGVERSVGSGGGGRAGAGPASARAINGGSKSQREEVEDSNFQHWFIAAVICSHRSKVFQCTDQDDVLRLFARAEVDFWATLDKAERSYRRYSQGREAMDRLLTLSA